MGRRHWPHRHNASCDRGSDGGCRRMRGTGLAALGFTAIAFVIVIATGVLILANRNDDREGTITRAQALRALEDNRRARLKLGGADCPTRNGLPRESARGP